MRGEGGRRPDEGSARSQPLRDDAEARVAAHRIEDMGWRNQAWFEALKFTKLEDADQALQRIRTIVLPLFARALRD